MNYGEYFPIDVLNGEGTRASLFLSGCEHNCRGCFNQAMLSPSYGKPFDKDMEDRIIADLQDTDIPRRGLSLLGGDPLFPANREGVLKLLKRVREECPTKDIWLWTGYSMDMAMPKIVHEIIALCNTVIDGKFEQEKYNPSLLWRGSSNQRIIQIFQKTC